MMPVTHTNVKKYSESFTTPEPEMIARLVKATKENLKYSDMLSGRQVGMLLRVLVSQLKPKRILEIGTFTGYSAVMMADVMEKGDELVTIEMNQHYQSISMPFFSESPFDEIIVQIIGNAREIIPDLEGYFGLIFLDADKINYPEYFLLLKRKLKKGGILVADNTLWGGEVISRKSEKGKAVHRFNELVRDDPDFEQVMLPVRDGITIARYIDS